MGLLQLPVETLVDILLFLNVPDSYAVQALNRFFHDVYKTSTLLQYNLECQIAHVRDNPNCHLSIPERLAMLRERESAWSSLTPTSQTTIKTGPTKEKWFLETQPHHYSLRRYLGLGTQMIMKTFETSPVRGTGWGPPHSIAARDILQEGYCIDEHDLIVRLTRVDLPDSQTELRLVLLQFSTGNVHPCAMDPSILVRRDELSSVPRGFGPVVIEISGETLILTIGIRQSGWMYVYNWKTGGSKSEPIQVSKDVRIVMLDHNLVIVPDRREWSLCIFSIHSTSPGGPVKLIQKLKLPPYRRSRRLWIRCKSLPNPTGDDRFPKHVSSSIPFMDRADTALISIVLPHAVSVLVHRYSIMKLLPPAESWTSLAEPPTLKWNSWGPPVTALRVGDLTTYGQRCLHDTFSCVMSYNFNMYHVRRSANAKQFKPYALHEDVKNVSTRLSFVEHLSPSFGDYPSICIADGAVVRMKYDKTVDILYFGH